MCKRLGTHNSNSSWNFTSVVIPQTAASRLVHRAVGSWMRSNVNLDGPKLVSVLCCRTATHLPTEFALRPCVQCRLMQAFCLCARALLSCSAPSSPARRSVLSQGLCRTLIFNDGCLLLCVCVCVPAAHSCLCLTSDLLLFTFLMSVTWLSAAPTPLLWIPFLFLFVCLFLQEFNK